MTLKASNRAFFSEFTDVYHFIYGTGSKGRIVSPVYIQRWGVMELKFLQHLPAMRIPDDRRTVGTSTQDVRSCVIELVYEAHTHMV